MIPKKNIVAHRGAWKDFNFGQNSVASFLKAQELGVGGTEFDLQFTKDEKVIVYHDDAFRKNYISQKRYIQLRGYQFFHRDKVLTFKKLLKYWEGKTTLWIELKPSKLNGMQKKRFVIEVLHILGHRTTNVHFISFDFFLLKELRKRSDYPCAYLGDDLSVEKLYKNEIFGVDAEYPRYFSEENLIEQADTYGLVKSAWTVNSLEEAKKLYEKGVQFITTDEVMTLLNG